MNCDFKNSCMFFAEFTYWLYCYCLRKLRNHWQTDLYFDWFIVFFPAILTTWRTTSSATLRNQRRQWRIFHSKESSCEYWVTHVIVNFRLVKLETGKPFNWFPKPVNRFPTGNWFWKRITSYQIFMMDLLTVHYAFAASLHVAATRSRQCWRRSLITISAQWQHVNATSLSTSAAHVLRSLILSAYVRMRLEKHGIADYRIMDKSYKTKETEDQKTRVRLNDCNPSFKLPRAVINSWRASCRSSHLLIDLLTPNSALAGCSPNEWGRQSCLIQPTLAIHGRLDLIIAAVIRKSHLHLSVMLEATLGDGGWAWD